MTSLPIQQLKLTLPLPPTLNSAYRNVAGIGRVKTKRVKEWAKEACLSLIGMGLSGIPLAPPYRVVLGLYFGDNRKSDIANREKIAVDFLVDQGVISDDSHIDEMVIRRLGVDRSNPRVEIEIETLHA